MKILVVSTISNTINSFLIPHIEHLNLMGHQVDLACNIQQELSPQFTKMKCRIFPINFTRNPININNITAIFKLKKIIEKEKYDIVHTHTPVASTCVRLACKNNSQTKVFYTAHGFHFFSGASLINWLIYYPIEFYLSKYTDLLITINNEDYCRSLKMMARRNLYLPGVGIDCNKFIHVNTDINLLRGELGIPTDSFVLLSIGELSKRKNHKVVLKTLKKLNNKSIYYVICGQGPLLKKLIKSAKKLKIDENVIMLGYRNDIPQILKISDAFIFPSLQEGLPVALMEAISTGLPVICSNIRGNVDLAKIYNDSFLVNKNDADGYCQAINKIYFRKKPEEIGTNLILQYDISNILNKFLEIYQN